MAKQPIDTVRLQLYTAYANLAMAHSAVVKHQQQYTVLNYKIRARLLKGLNDGSMNIRSIFDDEKVKLQTGQLCNYCGSKVNLALDHIFPKKYGGMDEAENLVYACRACNSSKESSDLMEWMRKSGRFLPLMMIRRYLKLTYEYCVNHKLLDLNLDDLLDLALPFRVDLVPISYPKPTHLVITAADYLKQPDTSVE